MRAFAVIACAALMAACKTAPSATPEPASPVAARTPAPTVENAGDGAATEVAPTPTPEETSQPAPPPADPQAVREAISRLDAAARAWAKTCKTPDPSGLCIAVRPEASSAAHCGTRVLGSITVRPRTRDAAKAHTELERAVEAASTLADPADPTLAQSLHEARGRAMVALHDADLEAYLEIRMPGDLDFFVEEWKNDPAKPKLKKEYERQVAKKNASTQAFKRFFEAKSEQGGELVKAYAETKEQGSPLWITQAALRTAWVSASMGDELVGTAVPKSLRTDEMRDAYCGALAAQVEPSWRLTRDAAEYCVEVAERSGLEARSAAACRDLLGRLPSDAAKQP